MSYFSGIGRSMGWRINGVLGVSVPIVPWHLRVEGSTLSEVEYVYLHQLYSSGICSVELFKRWHDHSFGGVYPEQLWFDLVKQRPDLVLDTELYSLAKKTKLREEGKVAYDLEAGYQAEDRSVPTRVMRQKDPGGVVLMYSGGGKSTFVASHPELGLVDGDALVDFPKAWAKSKKLRRSVMQQYENNVLQSCLAGRTVLVNMNDMKVVDRWMKSGAVVRDRKSVV